MAGRRDTLKDCYHSISVLCVHVAVFPYSYLRFFNYSTFLNLIPVLDLGNVSATRIAEQLLISGGSK